MKTRRHFIKAAAITTAGLGLGLSACSSEDTTAVTKADATPQEPEEQAGGLNILILGGTGFIGPHMVERALARGHSVTLFNRGRTNSDLFPGVETLIGDRDGKLDALEGRTWDAVIDNSGYVPRHVRDSAQLLSKAAKQYLFISSVSAYGNLEQAGIDEDYVLGVMEDETVEEVTGETYGPMKALCEQAVSDAFPGGATIVRPGYIVGPGDRSDRWTYWPLRVREGGEVLAPGTADDPIQIIDARDLAAFVIQALEDRTLGYFNAVGPDYRLTMGTMLERIKTLTGSDATFTWVSAETLAERNAFLPIWSSPTGETVGLHQVSNAKGMSKGLEFMPLDDTIRDTLAWWDTLDAERQSAMRAGLRVLDGPPEGLRPEPASLAEQMAAESALLSELKAG